jgi:hypothetical protein
MVSFSDIPLKNGEGVIMVDAGGGTIDFSAYALDENSDRKIFEEIVEPQCEIYFRPT